MSQRWRADGNTVSDLTGPRFEPHTSRSTSHTRRQNSTHTRTYKCLGVNDYVNVIISQQIEKISESGKIVFDFLKTIPQLLSYSRITSFFSQRYESRYLKPGKNRLIFQKQSHTYRVSRISSLELD